MSNSEDIDAINTYMKNQRSKIGSYPGLQTKLDNWDAWYNGLSWATKMYDASMTAARERRADVKNLIDTGVPWVPADQLASVYDQNTDTITIDGQTITKQQGSTGTTPIIKAVGTVAAKVKPSVTDATKLWQGKIGVPITGTFEATTQVATEKWQSDHGVSPVDGVVGDDTWFAAGFARGTMPLIQNLVKAPAKEGDSSNTTYAQAFAIWQKIVGVPVDGKAGPTTYNATLTWQKNRNCDADGVVGKQSWTAAGYVNAAKMPVLQTKGSPAATPPKPVVPPVPPKPVTPTLIAGFPVWAQVGLAGIVFGGLYKIWANKKEVSP
jgi:peptidoglycan hydrolase-like protein with peptidoglycan-binding domain